MNYRTSSSIKATCKDYIATIFILSEQRFWRLAHVKYIVIIERFLSLKPSSFLLLLLRVIIVCFEEKRYDLLALKSLKSVNFDKRAMNWSDRRRIGVFVVILKIWDFYCFHGNVLVTGKPQNIPESHSVNHFAQIPITFPWVPVGFLSILDCLQWSGWQRLPDPGYSHFATLRQSYIL